MGASLSGCCDAAGRTIWCDGGQLYCINCKAQGQTCGWSATYEFYDCDQVGEDPTGINPLTCPGACVPNCSGRVCGSDGCGGTCGPCPGSQFCINGQCYYTPPTCNGSSAPVGSECGGINYIGCCDSAGKTIWCQGGALYCVDCVGVGNPTCGWDSEFSSYDCGTLGGEDPLGEFPILCGPAPCVANCYLKSCGDDGCGGICGTCGPSQICNASNQCENQVCVPACTGKICGPNGCGGSCGECASTESCDGTGNCIPIVCDPSCIGKECGNNGCGGSCGQCGQFAQCLSGLCICDIPCEIGCCAPGEACFQGQCCTPDCAGRQCGDNGCGGSCGSCLGQDQCNASGICEPPPCEPSCTGLECGNDGCGGSCGSCGLYSACVSGTCLCEFNCAGNCCAPNDKCVGGQCCTPDCSGKECGSDGCNGSCGDCQLPETCLDGACTIESNPDVSPDVVTPDVVTPDVVTPDSNQTDSQPPADLAQDQGLTPDTTSPDSATQDTSPKDRANQDLAPVDQESDPGNGIIIPADQLDSDPQVITKTTGCAAKAGSASPLTLGLLLALVVLWMRRFRRGNHEVY